jgi:hypothetical protein
MLRLAWPKRAIGICHGAAIKHVTVSLAVLLTILGFELVTWQSTVLLRVSSIRGFDSRQTKPANVQRCEDRLYNIDSRMAVHQASINIQGPPSDAHN